MALPIAHSIRRLWFIACETTVVGIAFMLVASNGRANRIDPYLPWGYFAWAALLVTSLFYLRFSRRMSRIGFVTCGVTFLIPFLIPYIVE